MALVSEILCDFARLARAPAPLPWRRWAEANVVIPDGEYKGWPYWVNEHPLNVIMVDKLAQLARMVPRDPYDKQVYWAYEWVAERLNRLPAQVRSFP